MVQKQFSFFALFTSVSPRSANSRTRWATSSGWNGIIWSCSSLYLIISPTGRLYVLRRRKMSWRASVTQASLFTTCLMLCNFWFSAENRGVAVLRQKSTIPPPNTSASHEFSQHKCICASFLFLWGPEKGQHPRVCTWTRNSDVFLFLFV